MPDPPRPSPEAPNPNHKSGFPKVPEWVPIIRIIVGFRV